MVVPTSTGSAKPHPTLPGGVESHSQKSAPCGASQVSRSFEHSSRSACVSLIRLSSFSTCVLHESDDRPLQELKRINETQANRDVCAKLLDTCEAPPGALFCEWLATSPGKVGCGIAEPEQVTTTTGG